MAFIGVNTDLGAKLYFKDCAEQNMINAATNWVAQQQTHKEKKDPKPIRFKMIATYATRDANPLIPGDKGVHGAAPCGKCVDALAKVAEEGCEVLIFTRRPQAMRLELASHPTFSQVKEGKTWKTTMEQLNKNRRISLPEPQAAMQRAAMDEVIAEACGVHETPLTEEQKAVKARAVILAAKNEEEERESVAYLDAASETPHFNYHLKYYMQRQLIRTLRNRMEAAGVLGDLDAARAWVSEYAKSIRCCVTQLDDGTFHKSIESQVQRVIGKTKGDNAYPNPEVGALVQGMGKLGTGQITHLWTRELNPEECAAGLLSTSPKEGLERLFKRGPDMKCHFLPLGAAALSPDQADKITEKHTYSRAQVYPGAFGGAPATMVAVAPRGGKAELG